MKTKTITTEEKRAFVIVNLYDIVNSLIGECGEEVCFLSKAKRFNTKKQAEKFIINKLVKKGTGKECFYISEVENLKHMM
jgi:hypothetical protein